MDSAFKLMTVVVTAVALHAMWISGFGDVASNECNLTLTDDPSARILKGVPREAGIFIGQRQSIVTFYSGECFKTDVGVCFDTGEFGCNTTGTNTEDCDNFIRDVSTLDATCDPSSGDCRLYFSGSNALRPRSFFCNYTFGTAEMSCGFLNSNETDDTCLADNIDGSHVFQRNRDENATSLYNAGRMFYGVRRSSSTGESQIGVSDINVSTGVLSNPVLTRTDTVKQVDRAQFVGEPFSDGDYTYTYFLFREPAVEYTSLSFEQREVEKIYSRIARVCTNDEGVLESGKMIWTSYLKQRLVCYQETSDTDFHLYYDLIQDFVYDSATRLIYAIFTTERNGSPSSALCMFNLTEIDATFNNGYFFGTMSDTSIWKIYDDTTINPQPGYNCSNPNTADTNFMRHYSLVKKDPQGKMDAEGDLLCTLYGDRLTDIEREEGDVYIASSEKGCIYDILPSCNCSMPHCPISLQNTLIKDIAIVPGETGSNRNVIATTEDGAFFVDFSATEIKVFPEGTSHTVQANSEFELFAQCSPVCNVEVKNGTSNGMDLPDYLYWKTFFDPENTTVQIVVKVLWETTITFPGNTDCNVALTPIYEYTEEELEKRCSDWDILNDIHQELNATCWDANSTDPGTLNATILIETESPLAIQKCDQCVWADCAGTCPAY